MYLRDKARGVMRRLRRVTGVGLGGPVILMYHRVASPAFDPWQLSVSPDNFADQLAALQAHRTPMALDQFVAALDEGALPKDAVAITFDDGYLDNLTDAKPLLEAAGVPATVFLTVGPLGTDREFWWDALGRIVMAAPAPLELTLQLHSGPVDIALGEEPDQDADYRRRLDLYMQLWNSLQTLPPDQREQSLSVIGEHLAPAPATPVAVPMQRDQVRDLVAGTLISVGGHGVTHAPLPSLPAPARAAEIRTSREDSEVLSGTKVTGFAYPHGASNPETRAMVRAAGYRWAVSTRQASCRSGIDPYNLPRYQVCNTSGKELLRQLHRLEAM